MYTYVHDTDEENFKMPNLIAYGASNWKVLYKCYF